MGKKKRLVRSTHIRISKKLKKRIERKKRKRDSFSDYIKRRIR